MLPHFFHLAIQIRPYYVLWAEQGESPSEGAAEPIALEPQRSRKSIHHSKLLGILEFSSQINICDGPWLWMIHSRRAGR
jgi:hypothetical protein